MICRTTFIFNAFYFIFLLNFCNF